MEIIARLFALSLLFVLAPLFIIIMIGSVILQGLPVFFHQERIGFNYKPFMLYKFRTMVVHKSDQLITEQSDSRLTIWGKFLRKFKLDELPQLLNILKGDMRFVGPRPEVQKYVEGNDFSFLEMIKPGLTDFSSVILRNESMLLSKAGGANVYLELLSIKIQLCKLYARKKCFYTDLVIVVLTLLSLPFPNVAIRIVKSNYIEKYSPEIAPLLGKWI